jgi:hypothetical protein
MITPPKRYFVAQTTTSKHICIREVEEIAALLNANKIQEDYVAREWTGPSSDQMMQKGDTDWVTISQLLAAAYKDKPLVTVVLKDVENNTFLLSERYHSDAYPKQVALGAMENYLDQHFKEFAKTSPKDFFVYFKSDKCPPTVMTVKFKVESHTVKKGVTGYKGDPAEKTYPHTYDESESRKVEPPDEFPSVALELKPPKYDPTAYLTTSLR